MDQQQMIFLAIVFGVVFVIAIVAMAVLSPNRVRQRAASLAELNPAKPLEGDWMVQIAKAAEPLAKFSLPEEGWEKSRLRTRFMNAGWRNPSARVVYFGAKTALAVGLPLLATLLFVPGPDNGGHLFLLVLLLCAAIGYYLPNGVLSHAVEARQLEIFESFPDALDLLTVCVEAGLSLDSALAKVAQEIHVKSQVLSDELQLVLLEIRAGLPKDKALRNLAMRTGVEDVDTLVGMLIQAERFGTSMAESLRVHSDTLRTKRRLRAEEAAAKIALKLLFPLIFFIFPTLLVVLMGPAMIQIYRVLLPAFAPGN